MRDACLKDRFSVGSYTRIVRFDMISLMFYTSLMFPTHEPRRMRRDLSFFEDSYRSTIAFLLSYETSRFFRRTFVFPIEMYVRPKLFLVCTTCIVSIHVSFFFFIPFHTVRLDCMTLKTKWNANKATGYERIRRSFLRKTKRMSLGKEAIVSVPVGFEKVLFVETGFGCDQHGQDATVRNMHGR